MLAIVFAVLLGAAPALFSGATSRLVAVFVACVVAVLWHALYTRLERVHWSELIVSWRDWQTGSAIARLPFTLPGTLSDALAVNGGLAVNWLVRSMVPVHWKSLLHILLMLSGIGVGSALLGTETMVLSALAILAIQVGCYGCAWMSRGLEQLGIVLMAVLLWLAVVLGRSTVAGFGDSGMILAAVVAVGWCVSSFLQRRPVGVLAWGGVGIVAAMLLR